MPGASVHWEDADVLAVQAEAPDCEYALPELEQNDVRAHSNYNNAAFTVTGSHPPFAYIRSLDVGDGRFYDWDDQKEARRVAFLGSDAAKQLFPGRNPIGEEVYLNAFPYKVIGVMAVKKQDSSYDGWDVSKIFIPFAAMRRDFPDKPPGTSTTFDQLLVTPRSVEQHEACKREIQTVLGRMHNFDPHDKEACPIWDTVQEAKAFRQMTNGMKYFLGAVGIVTLFLGGLGVMNVMMVAVRERTREIGVRKALGGPGPHHPQTVLYRSAADRVAQRRHRDGDRIRHLLSGEFTADAGFFRRPGGDVAVGAAGAAGCWASSQYFRPCTQRAGRPRSIPLKPCAMKREGRAVWDWPVWSGVSDPDEPRLRGRGGLTPLPSFARPGRGGDPSPHGQRWFSHAD